MALVGLRAVPGAEEYEGGRWEPADVPTGTGRRFRIRVERPRGNAAGALLIIEDLAEGRENVHGRMAWRRPLPSQMTAQERSGLVAWVNYAVQGIVGV